MLTVEKLMEILSNHKPEDVVMTQDGKQIVHASNLEDGTLILSTEKPLGHCNRTGTLVFPTTPLLGYSAYCPELEEDLFEFEYTPFKEEDDA